MNAKDTRLPLPLYPDGHRASFVRMPDGIGHEIKHHLFDPAAVGIHRRLVHRNNNHLQPLSIQQVNQLVSHLFCQLTQYKRALLQLDGA
ncbi:hypothetical protein D3C81_1806720 [compost metagenome]